jgi:hypothetical protein
MKMKIYYIIFHSIESIKFLSSLLVSFCNIAMIFIDPFAIKINILTVALIGSVKNVLMNHDEK